MKKKTSLIKEFEEDKEKALQDYQRLQEQIIGVRYVIMYLDSKIETLKKEDE